MIKKIQSAVQPGAPLRGAYKLLVQQTFTSRGGIFTPLNPPLRYISMETAQQFPGSSLEQGPEYPGTPDIQVIQKQFRNFTG